MEEDERKRKIQYILSPLSFCRLYSVRDSNPSMLIPVCSWSWACWTGYCRWKAILVSVPSHSSNKPNSKGDIIKDCQDQNDAAKVQRIIQIYQNMSLHELCESFILKWGEWDFQRCQRIDPRSWRHESWWVMSNYWSHFSWIFSMELLCI
jgi:hypothetical protein